jgi:hypothetical protein
LTAEGEKGESEAACFKRVLKEIEKLAEGK